MHTCPDCGQACYCAGDIDDFACMTEEWSYEACTCCLGKDHDNDFFDEEHANDD